MTQYGAIAVHLRKLDLVTEQFREIGPATSLPIEALEGLTGIGVLGIQFEDLPIGLDDAVQIANDVFEQRARAE